MSAAHRHTTPDRNPPADASSSHLEAPLTHGRADSSADDASPPSVPPTDHSQAQSRSRSHTRIRARIRTNENENENENTGALAARIEHTRLRARVAALERELAASRRNRQAIVDQYERVLEKRECRTERRDRETGSAVTGDDARSRTESGSDSSASSSLDSDSGSGSDSNGRLVDFGTHVRRLLATVAR